MIAIIADDGHPSTGRRLADALEKAGGNVAHFSAPELDIRSCYGCGSCSARTYGRCVQKDDMDTVLAAIGQCSAWVLVSPVVFGSYSFQIKKVHDRTCTLGDPHYFVSNGEMVKGINGRDGTRFYAVGVYDGNNEQERNAFKALHAENVRIMNCGGEAFAIGSQASDVAIETIGVVIRHG